MCAFHMLPFTFHLVLLLFTFYLFHWTDITLTWQGKLLEMCKDEDQVAKTWWYLALRGICCVVKSRSFL